MQIKKTPSTKISQPVKKSRLYTGLRELYHTHGALTFLLAFYPLLPQMVEFHAKSYLGLTRRLTGSIHEIDEIIRYMFGKRGLAVYQEYKRKHPKQVLPEQIFEKFFQTNRPAEGLKLMKALFFDPYQRSLPHSDKKRAAIILAVPEIIRCLPLNASASRNTLIRQLCKQAIIDQAISSQLAFIEIALRLLTQKERYLLNLEKEQLDSMFSAIEAKIKAELAGKASAFTAPIRTFPPETKDPIIITNLQADSLREVLLLLAISPAIEVREDAKQAILELERLSPPHPHIPK